jgi:hypothetical protein
MKKASLKKIGWVIGMLVLTVGFLYLPVIPQYQLMEVFTEEGGYMEKSYTFSSLQQIIDDYPCSLHCFPSTDETVRFNVTAIVMASGVFLGILGLLMRKGFKVEKK